MAQVLEPYCIDIDINGNTCSKKVFINNQCKYHYNNPPLSRDKPRPNPKSNAGTSSTKQQKNQPQQAANNNYNDNNYQNQQQQQSPQQQQQQQNDNQYQKQLNYVQNKYQNAEDEGFLDQPPSNFNRSHHYQPKQGSNINNNNNGYNQGGQGGHSGGGRGGRGGYNGGGGGGRGGQHNGGQRRSVAFRYIHKTIYSKNVSNPNILHKNDFPDQHIPISAMMDVDTGKYVIDKINNTQYGNIHILTVKDALFNTPWCFKCSHPANEVIYGHLAEDCNLSFFCVFTLAIWIANLCLFFKGYGGYNQYIYYLQTKLGDLLLFYVYLIDKVWNLCRNIDPEHEPGIYILYILALTFYAYSPKKYIYIVSYSLGHAIMFCAKKFIHMMPFHPVTANHIGSFAANQPIDPDIMSMYIMKDWMDLASQAMAGVWSPISYPHNFPWGPFVVHYVDGRVIKYDFFHMTLEELKQIPALCSVQLIKKLPPRWKLMHAAWIIYYTQIFSVPTTYGEKTGCIWYNSKQYGWFSMPNKDKNYGKYNAFTQFYYPLFSKGKNTIYPRRDLIDGKEPVSRPCAWVGSELCRLNNMTYDDVFNQRDNAFNKPWLKQTYNDTVDAMRRDVVKFQERGNRGYFYEEKQQNDTMDEKKNDDDAQYQDEALHDDFNNAFGFINETPGGPNDGYNDDDTHNMTEIIRNLENIRIASENMGNVETKK